MRIRRREGDRKRDNDGGGGNKLFKARGTFEYI